jgi:hypothetical protein
MNSATKPLNLPSLTTDLLSQTNFKSYYLSFKKVTDHSVFEQTFLHCNQREAVGFIACMFPEAAVKHMSSITKVFISGKITHEESLIQRKLPS